MESKDKDVQKIYDLLKPEETTEDDSETKKSRFIDTDMSYISLDKEEEAGNNNNYTFSDQKSYNKQNNGEKEMKKAKTSLERLNEFVKSDKPLVEKTIWITNFKGTKFPKKIWVDPETGERRLNTKNKVVTRTGEKEDKSKTEEKKKQIDYKEAQNIQEKLARQERAEESGVGERSEFGPTETSWFDKLGVKFEETPSGFKYSGKGKTVELKNTVTGWAVYTNGERTGKFVREKDATEKAKSIFLGEGEKEK